MTHNLKSKSPQAAFPVDPLSVLEAFSGNKLPVWNFKERDGQSGNHTWITGGQLHQYQLPREKDPHEDCNATYFHRWCLASCIVAAGLMATYRSKLSAHMLKMKMTPHHPVSAASKTEPLSSSSTNVPKLKGRWRGQNPPRQFNALRVHKKFGRLSTIRLEDRSESTS